MIMAMLLIVFWVLMERLNECLAIVEPQNVGNACTSRLGLISLIYIILYNISSNPLNCICT